MNITKNFKAIEFKSSEGILTSLSIVQMLQQLRDVLDSPVTVKHTKVLHLSPVPEVYIQTTNEKGSSELQMKLNLSDVPVYGPNPALTDVAVALLSDPDQDKFITKLSEGELIALAVALQSGYKEGPNNDNMFGRHFEFNNLPWCSLLFHWGRAVSRAVKGQPNLRFKPSMSNSLSTLTDAYKIIKDPRRAKPGDCIVWKRPGSATSGHTGICLANDKKHQMLTICEGNLADSVQVTKRSYSTLTYGKLEFQGFGRYHNSPKLSGLDLFKKLIDLPDDSSSYT